jgi:hypothetical protein
MKFPPLYLLRTCTAAAAVQTKGTQRSVEREIEKASVMDVNMQIGTAVRVYKCTTRENSNFTRAAVMSLVFICKEGSALLGAAGKDISSRSAAQP